MKKRLSLLPFCLFFVALSAQTGDMESVIQQEKSAYIRRQAMERNGQQSAVNRSDLHYSRYRWQVDPAVHYIRGEVMTVFEPVENVSNLDFDFSAALTMDSIFFHGQPLAFARSGDIITVTFPSALPAFLSDSLTFYYQGAPPSEGFGAFVTNIHGEDSIPVLWTLSEPYGAKYWYPCKISLDDKLDSVDIFITAPAAYRAASNGLLMSETTQNGQKTAHWKHRYPITAYLVCMAVTNYTVFENLVPAGDDTIRVLNYVYPEDLGAGLSGTGFIVSQMQLFNELFGIYPFQNEKYGHAQFGWGGGMEHQTMTFVTNFGYELLAHELAHHWFGDKVTCGSWEDLWLNEGFATYLSGLCYEFLAPVYWQNFKQQRIDNITSVPDGSVRVNDTTDIGRLFSGRLTYAKGAMVIHSLRWVCGDSAFFAGVRNYLNAPGIAYGYARADDLRFYLEQASGKDLAGFFADWIVGEGYPSYHLTWAQDTFGHLTVNLDQQQSHPSVSFFELPVPVRFSNGQQDTILVLQHLVDGQTFDFDLDFTATEVVIDPDLWLISKNNSVQQVSSAREEVLPGIKFLLTPNPTRAYVNVVLELERTEQLQVRLFDRSGKLLQEKNLSLAAGMQILPFEVGTYAAGTYMLVLKTEKGQVSKRVVVVKG